MCFESGECYHVYNRGNNKRRIFYSDENYWSFIRKIEIQIGTLADLIAYTLMPNHYHLMLQPKEAGLVFRDSFGTKPMQELSYRIGIIQSSYSQLINNQNKSTGSVFQQRAKCKLLTKGIESSGLSYFEHCFHYIHRNPLEAGLVSNLNDWPFSSYLDYIQLKNESLCNKEIFFGITGLTVDQIIKRTVDRFDDDILKKIL